MRSVVHLVPYDAIGGVETAAGSLPAGEYNTLLFYKYFLAQRGGKQNGAFTHHGPRRSENHPLNYIRAIAFLWKLRPNLVIGSLWRSCIVLILFKLLRRKTKAIVFLHSAGTAHPVDAVLNRVAMVIASEIWADSETTLQVRVPKHLRGRTRVISFVTDRLPEPEVRNATPTFVFWGRLHRHKRLDRAIRLFARLKDEFPDASYTIIGPDGGELPNLRELCRHLNVEDSVNFLGPRKRDEIPFEVKGIAFYLQTSAHEGMAMSVVEAMQLGIVPVVTPVGEISRYCIEDENSILIKGDDDAVVAKLRQTIHLEEAYRTLSEAAARYWRQYPLYSEQVLEACFSMTRNDRIEGTGLPTRSG